MQQAAAIIAGRGQIICGTLAMFMHFSTIITMVDLDTLVRTCTCSKSLSLVLARDKSQTCVHPLGRGVILFVAGAFCNVLQVAFVFGALYGLWEAVLYTLLLLLVFYALMKNHAHTLKARKQVLEWEQAEHEAKEGAKGSIAIGNGLDV